MLIDEAVDNGARLSKACKRLGITERTYYRWIKLNKTFDSYADRRNFAVHSNPVNKITPAERQEILDTVNSEEFARIHWYRVSLINLIRVFYAVLTKGMDYDRFKMMSDIHRNSELIAA